MKLCLVDTKTRCRKRSHLNNNITLYIYPPFSSCGQATDNDNMNAVGSSSATAPSSASSHDHGYDPISSPRTTKAAFFRTRSPPISDHGPQSASLAQQFEQVVQVPRSGASVTSANSAPGGAYGRQTPESDRGSGTRSSARAYHQQQLQIQQQQLQQQQLQQRMGGRSPTPAQSEHEGSMISPPLSSGQPKPLAHRLSQRSQRNMYPTPSSSITPRDRYGMNGASDSGSPTSEQPHTPTASSPSIRGPGSSPRQKGSASTHETSVMGFAGGSDEMLMALLAGQAVVDCEKLPVGGWEEVEGWKKELSLLDTRLESLVARHQREVKILTAARTLQKLNTANKR